MFELQPDYSKDLKNISPLLLSSKQLDLKITFLTLLAETAHVDIDIYLTAGLNGVSKFFSGPGLCPTMDTAEVMHWKVQWEWAVRAQGNQRSRAMGVPGYCNLVIEKQKILIMDWGEPGYRQRNSIYPIYKGRLAVWERRSSGACNFFVLPPRKLIFQSNEDEVTARSNGGDDDYIGDQSLLSFLWKQKSQISRSFCFLPVERPITCTKVWINRLGSA